MHDRKKENNKKVPADKNSVCSDKSKQFFFFFSSVFQTKVKSDFIKAVNTSEILFSPKLFSKIQVRVIRKSGLYIPFYDIN